MTTESATLKSPAFHKGLLSFGLSSIIKMILISAGFALAALLVVYVFQVNAQVGNESFAQSCEARIGNLSEGNQEMELNLVRVNSIEKIMPEISKLNFVKPEKISYINITNGKVVLNTIRNGQ